MLENLLPLLDSIPTPPPASSEPKEVNNVGSIIAIAVISLFVLIGIAIVAIALFRKEKK